MTSKLKSRKSTLLKFRLSQLLPVKLPSYLIQVNLSKTEAKAKAKANR